jgi:lipopolysaccharide export system protein LptC
VSPRALARNTRGLSVLVPLTILLMLVMLTTWLNRTVELSAPAPARPPTHDADYTADNFTVVRLSDTGEIHYVLSAAHLVHYPDDDTAHLRKPVFKELQPGKPEVRLSADRGITTSGGEEVRLYDNVEVFRAGDKAALPHDAGAQDLRATTSYLRARPDEDTADTPERVVIHDGQSILIGTGMDADNRYRNMHLHSAVTGTYIQAPQPDRKNKK